MTGTYVVTRNVAADEPNNWLGRAARAGEIFTEFTGCDYGSVDNEAGIALCEDPAGPFFEFPRDAVRPAR